MKRLLQNFFVAMLLSAVAINSYAYQVGETIDVGDGFTYRIVSLSPTYTLAVASISKTGAVEIPSSVFDGDDLTFTVTELACGGSADITSVKLPNTITKISSLQGFPGVTTFRIPKSVTSINTVFYFGNSTSSRWTNLESWDVENGNTVFASEDGILYSNDFKTLYSIPYNKNYVNSDGSYSVRDGVEQITATTTVSPYPSALTTNKYANNLKKLILPASLKGLSSIIRNYLPNLEAFEVKTGNENLKDDGNGVLLTADGSTVLLYPLGKQGDYTVPDGVTTIQTNAFQQSKFTNLNLNSATTLKKNAITYCYYLTSLDLGNVVTMENSSVYICPQLKTITIPASLTDLQDGAIVSCANVKEYIVKEGNPKYSSHDGVLYSAIKEDGTREKLLLYPPKKEGETYSIPTEFGITEIARNAFQSAQITSITIPSTVMTIGNNAFTSSKIQEVNFESPSALTKIGDGAFSGTKSLKSFTWPEGVDTIPQSCFSSGGLESLIIPDNVKSIENNAFYVCDYFTTVKVGKGVTKIGNFAFANTALSNIEFDEKSSVTAIGYAAFSDCPLTSFTLPTSLKDLDHLYGGYGFIFRNCLQLKEIIVPDGSELTNIYQFGAPNLETFTFKGSSNVTTIGNNAFKDHVDLTELHFPSTVKTLGNQAFMGCTNLESVTFEGGEAEITFIGNAAFAECGLKSFEVPNKVETIGNEAFRNCDVLATVSVPSVTRSIDPLAFRGCTTMTAINVDKKNQTYSSSDGILLTKNKETLVIFPMGKANSNFTLLPPSITKIGNHAFYQNDKLENVTIPNKVTTIGDRAFGLCPNLNTVTMLCDEMIDPANIAQAQNYSAFDDGVTTTDEQFSKITLNVRKELLADYQGSEYYGQFGEIKPSFVDETSRAGGLNKTKAKEEFIAVSGNTVDLLSVDTEDETYVLPATVKQGNKTYAVSLVGDYLFTATGSSVAKVKEVVVPGNVEYIGARAFMTDATLTSTSSTVENVFLIGETLNEDLLSTARFELTAEDLGSSTTKRYDEFGNATKIYVRKSAEETYKDAWAHYADNISYQIPFTQTGEYGTFAREFDVDFSEVNGVNADKPVTDDPVLIAFTGDGKYNKNGNTFSVHMTSINLGDKTGKDGTYVPAGSGVLMKKYKDAEGENGLYYQIAETGISEAFVEGNFMKGITLRPETIGAGSDVKRYYISGGTLHEMTKNTDFKNHKSYMELPADAVPAEAKVTMSFGNWDNEATGIESINANVDDNDNLYNLQGQRVNNAGKGIYIKNGKKIFVK